MSTKHHPQTYRVAESTRFLLTILSFGLIFSLVTIIYDYMNYRQELSLLQSSQATIGKTPQETWEIYRDTRVGIRFAYPEIFGVPNRLITDPDTLDTIEVLSGELITYRFSQEFDLTASVMTLDYQDSRPAYLPWEIKSFLPENQRCRTNWGQTFTCTQLALEDGGAAYVGTTDYEGDPIYLAYIPLTRDPNILTFVFHLNNPSETNIRILNKIIASVRRI